MASARWQDSDREEKHLVCSLQNKSTYFCFNGLWFILKPKSIPFWIIASLTYLASLTIDHPLQAAICLDELMSYCWSKLNDESNYKAKLKKAWQDVLGHAYAVTSVWPTLREIIGLFVDHIGGEISASQTSSRQGTINWHKLHHRPQSKKILAFRCSITEHN